jgi:hypothetical protein
MKDFILPMIPLSGLLAVTMEDAPFWERIAEKWGIGFVGLALFCALAFWTSKREDRLQAARDKRDVDAQAERLALLTKNNELGEKMIQQHKDHSLRLEQIIKDGNKAQTDVGVELKNLARRVRCPGTLPPSE